MEKITRRILYLNRGEDLTLTCLHSSVESYTMNNGFLPDIILIDSLENYHRLLAIKSNYFIGIMVIDIKELEKERGINQDEEDDFCECGGRLYKVQPVHQALPILKCEKCKKTYG